MPQSLGRIEGDFVQALPLRDRILVQPNETPEYKGKIIIPDSAKTAVPSTGVVLAIGRLLRNDPDNELKIGDVIIYSKYAGVECKFDDGKRVLLISEDDALAILGSEVQLMEEVK